MIVKTSRMFILSSTPHPAPASSQFEFNCKTLNHKSNIDKRPVSVFSHFKHLVKNESQETKIEKNPLKTTHKVNKGTIFYKIKNAHKNVD